MLHGDFCDRRPRRIAAAENGVDVAQPLALKKRDRTHAGGIAKSTMQRAPRRGLPPSEVDRRVGLRWRLGVSAAAKLCAA